MFFTSHVVAVVQKANVATANVNVEKQILCGPGCRCKNCENISRTHPEDTLMIMRILIMMKTCQMYMYMTVMMTMRLSWTTSCQIQIIQKLNFCNGYSITSFYNCFVERFKFLKQDPKNINILEGITLQVRSRSCVFATYIFGGNIFLASTCIRSWLCTYLTVFIDHSGIDMHDHFLSRCAHVDVDYVLNSTSTSTCNFSWVHGVFF